MQVITTNDIVENNNNKQQRPSEYLLQLEQLKHNFKRTRDIITNIIDIGLKHDLTKEEIRNDIEVALHGIVKPRQLIALLPTQLKRKYNIINSKSADPAHLNNNKIRFPAVIVKKDENRKVINIPKSVHPQLEGKKKEVIVTLEFV